ncbi:helix-turn-helix transcriptional regulator [Lutimaribacter sp. EGI FJ00013]|uniref:Helix-turn-helix transcriptional regulator n=1 Tax=Lutimaribacter degradans TaxID=2945989 RepID=A0ACC5ZZB5_9RHOB|nr:helix-turn-helix transcriptional regulator [Lutimaribacter sp. EGI FJ00013]
MSFDVSTGFDFEEFRSQLLRIMKEKGLSPHSLSVKAGLNPRAVKDIEERRVKNPRVSTVISLENALDVLPGTLLGISPETNIKGSLLNYLGALSQEDQDKLLDFLRSLSNRRI